MANTVTVELCMGSSCFARGNSENLQAIETYLEENGLSDRVELVGHLCLDKCNQGPNIKINGKDYSAINPEDTIALIVKALEESGE